MIKKLIGMKLGTFMVTYSQASLFIAIGMNVLNAGTFYNTTGREILPGWINGWLFFGMLALAIVGLLVVVKVLVTPSIMSYTNKVAWENENPSKIILEEHSIEIKQLHTDIVTMKKELLDAIKAKNS